MDVDDLYGLPLDRFVPERTKLARTLRSDGQREAAAEVASLKKPSVSAWAVNQLVRTQRRAVRELFDAGDALRTAHEEVLAGGGAAEALHKATERERSAVDELVYAARGLLTSEGHGLSGAVIDRVGATLHAAALDEDARQAVENGRLERELRHVGLGAGATLPAPASRSGERRARSDTTARESTRESASEQANARRAARAAEAQARRRLERAERALRRAEERSEAATRALREADAGLQKARAEAQDAAEAHRRARTAVDGS
jgi:hypothetical protein